MKPCFPIFQQRNTSIFITLLYLLFCNISIAQVDEFCGTPDKTEPDPVGVYSKSVDIGVFDAFNSKTFNIYYWRINKDDGSYTQPGFPLTPERAKLSVEYLNDAFADLNICFNLLGMGEINSTAHHTGSSLGSIHNYAVAENLARQDAFNIYAPHSLSQGAGQASYNRTRVAVLGSKVVGNALAHEIGHSFNLTHTFGNSNLRPHPINCERVTRIVTDPEYNANVAGDEVTDTHAVPNFQREQHNHVASAVETANIGYTWSEARNQIALNENGFSVLQNAAAIEQALLVYGFTQAEIDHLRFNPAENYAYADIPSCSYIPDSRINVPNSPFFKDCGGSPYQYLQFQFDCNNTMSYFHISCRNYFSVGQRIRVHEAIEFDQYGEFASALSNTVLDIYMMDTETDIGQEPNIHTNNFWNSEDIWVRNQNDGTVNQEHQNPEYDPLEPNYAYVKVRNKACSSSSGNEELKLYWAKANTALSWPLHWEGNLTVIDSNGEEVLMGDEIGTLNIPALGIGESTILEFEWYVPNPDDYMNINNNNPWHFCLLARIVSNADPMTFPEEEFITDNVKNNNNIVWKNLTIVDIVPNTPSPVGGIVAVGNFFDVPESFDLEFFEETEGAEESIYNEAEVSITLDDIIFDAWTSGGSESENFSPTAQNNKIIVEDNYAIIKNIQLDPGEIGTISVSFNFLMDELTNNTKYTYHLIQRNPATNKTIGGETFEVRKQQRPVFDADAGDDAEIDENESITVSAEDINETATYNWYDPQGNLIHTGTDLTVSPDITQTYKLEVISDMDGYKDYDAIEITVNPHRIESLVPNPVMSQLTVSYMVDGVTSAYLMVVNQSTGATNNYILDESIDEVIVDVSGYSTGLYSVILVCEGEIQDSKNLTKQ